MTKAIEIILIDDHQIVIDGILAMLAGHEGIEILKHFTDPQQALDFLDTTQVDLVLTDIQMPKLSGTDVLRYCKSKFPHTKVLALSMHTDKNVISELINSGLDGYLMKISGRDEFIKAIESCASGHSYFSAETVQILTSQNPINNAHPSLTPLTKREIEILSMIAQGLTNKEMAQKLNLSHRTVETHRSNLGSKLNVTHTAGLTKIAIEAGLA